MTTKKKILELMVRIPYFNKLYKEYFNFKLNSIFPAGHYYSPIILVADIRKREKEIWSKLSNDGIQGIDLQTENQKELVKKLSKYYHEIPFTTEKQPFIRYYGYAD